MNTKQSAYCLYHVNTYDSATQLDHNSLIDKAPLLLTRLQMKLF